MLPVATFHHPSVNGQVYDYCITRSKVLLGHTAFALDMDLASDLDSEQFLSPLARLLGIEMERGEGREFFPDAFSYQVLQLPSGPLRRGLRVLMLSFFFDDAVAEATFYQRDDENWVDAFAAIFALEVANKHNGKESIFQIVGVFSRV